MRYQQILDCDIADGEGVRVVLFVSGCSHHCKGCHNPESWNPDNGKEFTDEVKEKLFNLIDRPYIDGLTLTGGDPLHPANIDCIEYIVNKVKEVYPDKTIWCYTGYSFEDVKNFNVMKHIDILIDGLFVQELRDITLRFKGSSNQRVIDVQKSLNSNEVVLWQN